MFVIVRGNDWRNDEWRDEWKWMGERSWMWIPALLTLVLGVVVGWGIFWEKE